MRDAVIVDAVRTPVAKGKAGGGYAHIHPVDLHAHALRSLLARVPGLDAAEIDDVVGGAVAQVGEQSTNTTRLAVLAAGLPESVPGTTVDRQCGSSQQALSFAAQGLVAGAYDIVIASGVESMSRVPIGSSALVGGVRADVAGPSVAARYPGGLVPQGVSAELLARKWALSRTRLDEFAATSHHRAAEAWRGGWFAAEVAPVPGAELPRDETIRPDTGVERLAALPVAFAHDHWTRRFGELDWKVTAGNSSPLNDGSAALLLTTSETARRRGWRPRARVHTATVVVRKRRLLLRAPGLRHHRPGPRHPGSAEHHRTLAGVQHLAHRRPGGLHRQDPGPGPRHRQRVRRCLRHAVRQP
ncbi:thiolase family protein [Dactylosporangium sp. CA-139066]|uniref:thiolase family protein n=1 Tax=Dactylosporangium sp. CA-139066 TaxID=3239930 RepID=UPI003D8AB30C